MLFFQGRAANILSLTTLWANKPDELLTRADVMPARGGGQLAFIPCHDPCPATRLRDLRTMPRLRWRLPNRVAEPAATRADTRMNTEIPAPA